MSQDIDQVTPPRLQPTAPAGAVGLRRRLGAVRRSRLIRQNLVLFSGGLVAGIGGFLYHAIAGRVLGPARYGEVASLIALFSVTSLGTLLISLVLASYSARLTAEDCPGGIRTLTSRSLRMLVLAGVVAAGGFLILSGPLSDFLHLGSRSPLVVLGVATAAYWLVAVPRGILQGTQHFTALSLNLSVEMMVRTLTLVVFLAAGLAVLGASLAVFCGAVVALVIGMWPLRTLLRHQPAPIRMRTLAGFSASAAAATAGVLLLYNQDVILARHYLPDHAAGIYGGLNKIETIIFFLTLSISQVMFPRVVEALARRNHPGRLLVLSAALIGGLGMAALAGFTLLPGLVVRTLYGPQFADATVYVGPAGLIGTCLSLVNLLVQFLLAAHGRGFIPILGAGCLLEVGLVVWSHASVGLIVVDALIAIGALLVALAGYTAWLLPRLTHPAGSAA